MAIDQGLRAQDAALDLLQGCGPVHGSTTTDSLFAASVRRFAGHTRLSRTEAGQVLHQAGCDLSAGRGSDLALTPAPQAAAAWRLIGLARAALAEDSRAVTQFEGILTTLRDYDLLPTRTGTTGSAARHTAPLRVFLLGAHSPLARAPLRRHLGARIAFVDRAEEADLVVTRQGRDLTNPRAGLAALWQGGVRPGLVVLSADLPYASLPYASSGSGDLYARDRIVDCGAGVRLSCRSLNPANSGIFQFLNLPWSVFSDDALVARHALLIAPFAALSPRALLRHWQSVPWQVAFMARRHADSVLGQYRARVAELAPELVPGARVLQTGRGQPGLEDANPEDPSAPVPDRHLDRLARLHGQVRLCSAYESTLHPCHVTQKPFDAFAVGAIPVTLADAGHRLFDLILPEAMLNTLFCAPDVAAARIMSFVPDMVVAEAWHETALALLARLRDPALILAERQRMADACIEELAHVARSAARTALST